MLHAQPTLWCAFDSAPSIMPHSIDPGSYRSPDRQRPAVPLPIETEPRTHDPYAAFRFGDFALFTGGNLLSITGRLMLAVAVEWVFMPGPTRRLHSGLLAWQSPSLWLRFRCQPAIWRIGSAASTSSFRSAGLERDHVAGPRLGFLEHLSTSPTWCCCVRAITPWQLLPRYSSAITKCFTSMTHQSR